MGSELFVLAAFSLNAAQLTAWRFLSRDFQFWMLSFQLCTAALSINIQLENECSFPADLLGRLKVMDVSGRRTTSAGKQQEDGVRTLCVLRHRDGCLGWAVPTALLWPGLPSHLACGSMLTWCPQCLHP